MGAEDVSYEELLSEVLDSIGLGALPDPADRWVELPDLIAQGLKRGMTDAQVRRAADKAVVDGTHERQKHGRRIFYREKR